MLLICSQIVWRDVILAWRNGAGIVSTIGMYALIVLLIPFSLGPDATQLSRIAPGVLWIALSLALLLTLDRLFQTDFEDGSLDLIMLSSVELEFLVLAKCIAHWIVIMVPLLLLTPVLALLLSLPFDRLAAIMVSLTVGSPALVLVGAMGAALAVAVRRGGILIGLLVLPLYVPIIIFGVAAAQESANVFFAGGEGRSTSLLLLGALSLFSLVLAPLAAAAALRANNS